MIKKILLFFLAFIFVWSWLCYDVSWINQPNFTTSSARFWDSDNWLKVWQPFIASIDNIKTVKLRKYFTVWTPWWYVSLSIFNDWWWIPWTWLIKAVVLTWDIRDNTTDLWEVTFDFWKANLTVGQKYWFVLAQSTVGNDASNRRNVNRVSWWVNEILRYVWSSWIADQWQLYYITTSEIIENNNYIWLNTSYLSENFIILYYSSIFWIIILMITILSIIKIIWWEDFI